MLLVTNEAVEQSLLDTARQRQSVFETRRGFLTKIAKLEARCRELEKQRAECLECRKRALLEERDIISNLAVKDESIH